MSNGQEKQENKTERVQLLMTPSEVEAIDNWGFANRIRTRAETIRQLCAFSIAAIPLAEYASIIVRQYNKMKEYAADNKTDSIESDQLYSLLNDLLITIDVLCREKKTIENINLLLKKDHPAFKNKESQGALIDLLDKEYDPVTVVLDRIKKTKILSEKED